jgi:hypothetical protein
MDHQWIAVGCITIGVSGSPEVTFSPVDHQWITIVIIGHISFGSPIGRYWKHRNWKQKLTIGVMSFVPWISNRSILISNQSPFDAS